MNNTKIKLSPRFAFGGEPARHDIAGEIARLRAMPQTPEQSRKLADLLIELAIEKQAANDSEAALKAFGDAIVALQDLKGPTASPDVVHLYGVAVRNWASLKHEQGDDEAALAAYAEAIDALTPLDAQGDGEAKFDLAGIRFHRGVVYHSLGDFENAAKDFDAAFLAFRALEKISDLNDTRLFMAKVSVAQGNLARDRGADVATTDDLYNRAMRLLVELIEGGQAELEHDLAVVLVDRCTTRFDANIANYRVPPYDEAIFNPLLDDMQQGIGILERQAASGSPAVVRDLFCAILTHGTMLLDLGQFDKAAMVLTSLLGRFPEVVNSTEPAMQTRVAGLYENLAIALFQQSQHAAAISRLTLGVQLRERVLAENADALRDELVDYVCDLAMSYLNRIEMRNVVGDSAGAKQDADFVRKLSEIYLGSYPQEAKNIETRLRSLNA
ncbi:MAG: hypothetical protein ACRC46_12400 [Thermoguttaceae bacterium]